MGLEQFGLLISIPMVITKSISGTLIYGVGSGEMMNKHKRNCLVIAIACFAIFFIFSLLLCFEVKAEDTFFDKHEVSIGLGIYTEHFRETNGDGKPYNNTNNIIVVSIDQWFATTFMNSQYVRSYAFGYSFRTPKWKPLKNEIFTRATLLTGVVYGYEGKLPDVDGWSPAIIPGIEIGYKKISIETVIMPTSSGMVASALKFTF